MRGVTVRSPEALARARKLRVAGHTYKQIGAVLGISLQAAHEWLTDPDGLVERVESFATVEAAARAFEVAVMFDVTARLVHREGDER